MELEEYFVAVIAPLGMSAASHLVWKPYFIFGLPVVLYLLILQFVNPERWRWIGLGIYFVMLNLTIGRWIGT